MRISIDTAADSKEDIRKAIRLLQALVDHDASQGSRNLFDAPGADLFGSTPAQSQPSEPSASPVSAFGSLFGDDAPAQQAGELLKEKKDFPQIEFY